MLFAATCSVVLAKCCFLWASREWGPWCHRGWEPKQCCKCTRTGTKMLFLELSGLHNALTNYRSLVWHKLSSWSRAGSTQEGLVPPLGPEAGLGVRGALEVRAGSTQSCLHTVNGAARSRRHKAPSELHTNDWIVSLWSLNISAISVLCISVSFSWWGWKHLYISLLIGMLTLLGLQQELL